MLFNFLILKDNYMKFDIKSLPPVDYSYFDLEENEAKKMLQNIVSYATQNKESFLKFVYSLPISEESTLDLIYRAIGTDMANWQDFIVDEYKRVYDFVEKNNETTEVLALLDAFYIMTDTKLPLAKQIQNFLISKLSSTNETIKHYAAILLEEWIDVDRSTEHYSMIEALKSLLTDESFKMRYLAYKLLINADVDPKEIKLSFWDTFRIKLGLASNPYNL